MDVTAPPFVDSVLNGWPLAGQAGRRARVANRRLCPGSARPHGVPRRARHAAVARARGQGERRGQRRAGRRAAAGGGQAGRAGARAVAGGSRGGFHAGHGRQRRDGRGDAVRTRGRGGRRGGRGDPTPAAGQAPHDPLRLGIGLGALGAHGLGRRARGARKEARREAPPRRQPAAQAARGRVEDVHAEPADAQEGGGRGVRPRGAVLGGLQGRERRAARAEGGGAGDAVGQASRRPRPRSVVPLGAVQVRPARALGPRAARDGARVRAGVRPAGHERASGDQRDHGHRRDPDSGQLRPAVALRKDPAQHLPRAQAQQRGLAALHVHAARRRLARVPGRLHQPCDLGRVQPQDVPVREQVLEPAVPARGEGEGARGVLHPRPRPRPQDARSPLPGPADRRVPRRGDQRGHDAGPDGLGPARDLLPRVRGGRGDRRVQEGERGAVREPFVRAQHAHREVEGQRRVLRRRVRLPRHPRRRRAHVRLQVRERGGDAAVPVRRGQVQGVHRGELAGRGGGSPAREEGGQGGRGGEAQEEGRGPRADLVAAQAEARRVRGGAQGGLAQRGLLPRRGDLPAAQHAGHGAGPHGPPPRRTQVLRIQARPPAWPPARAPPAARGVPGEARPRGACGAVPGAGGVRRAEEGEGGEEVIPCLRRNEGEYQRHTRKYEWRKH